jgi:GNAT superfamily N-acetyltransferase
MISFRPATEADYPFALHLYVEGMRGYTEAWMTWTDEEQTARFAGNWRVGNCRIIALDGAGDIGWLDVDLSGEAPFLRQLYIAKPHRGRGLGGAVMQQLIAEWGDQPANLSVLLNNPARRLYERCGFVPEREDGMRLWMRREPPKSSGQP